MCGVAAPIREQFVVELETEDARASASTRRRRQSYYPSRWGRGGRVCGFLSITWAFYFWVDVMR